jgi:histidinol-phosphatase (PHP family)
LLTGQMIQATTNWADTYPLRTWPAAAGPFDISGFQGELHHALRALARSSRALEINTSGPLHPEIVRWWREAGGTSVTFGSNAHDPTGIDPRPNLLGNPGTPFVR